MEVEQTDRVTEKEPEEKCVCGHGKGWHRPGGCGSSPCECEGFISRDSVIASNWWARFLVERVDALEAALWDSKQAQVKLEKLVTMDALTGSANRRGILQRLESLLSGMERKGSSVFVAYLDLDGFKEINDELGHAAGDGVLATITHRLIFAVRPDDTVGRVGGDEFVIVGYNEHPQEFSLESLGERLVKAIGDPIVFNDKVVNVGASIGIIEHVKNGHSASADSLIDAADKLMYSVKKNGKNRCAVAKSG